MAINRIPINTLEILNLFMGSFDSECLPLADRNFRILSQAGMSFGQRINPFLFLSNATIVCNRSLF